MKTATIPRMSWDARTYEGSLLEILSVSEKNKPVDVDYIDCPYIVISDPARLLTQHSMTPFWIEDRKRERLNNAIFDIEAKICAVLKDFENTRLKLPTFDNHCPNRWEQVSYDIVFEAFVDLEEQIKDLLAKFIGRSANQTWELWECHGLDDTQYIRYRRRQREVKLRSQLRNALYADIYSRFSEQSSFSDNDLPF